VYVYVYMYVYVYVYVPIYFSATYGLHDDNEHRLRANFCMACNVLDHGIDGQLHRLTSIHT
jgi:hypothetical protein